MLLVIGLSQQRQFQKYHRVLNRVKVSAAGLLTLRIEASYRKGSLVIVADDMIQLRSGARITANGIDGIRCVLAKVIWSRPASCACYA
jgi:hypothetical protein